MRTTVDIEPGLLKRLRHEALRRRVPFKHLLNRLLRQGLESPAAAPAGRYRCPTYAMGAPASSLSLDKALGLAAALEDEETLRELQLRK
jgi:hypothetical protein